MKVTDKIDLRNCDNMDLMAKYPDNYFDLAIVDPPYGIDWLKQIKNPNVSANWKEYSAKKWDGNTPSKKYFKELFRVSKNQIIWGGNYMVENLYSSPCWLLWDKMQEFSGATFEMAWTSFKSPSKAFRMSRVEAYCNILKIHPTQKPTKLYNWLLENYAKEGDKILDTHLGSGSIAIACHYWGFELVGCELDEEYYNQMLERFKRETAQLSLLGDL